MRSLQCRRQNYLVCQIIYGGIFHFECKCIDQEKRHKNCHNFLSQVLILLDKYPHSVFQRCFHHLMKAASINRKELLIFRTLIVPSLRYALTQSASLWAWKRFAKNGAGSDPIAIPITWIIIIFPMEKKQLRKRNLIASLSNNLVKTKWCPLLLDDHDAQPCLLIIM